jgi:hypothetical protein
MAATASVRLRRLLPQSVFQRAPFYLAARAASHASSAIFLSAPQR